MLEAIVAVVLRALLEDLVFGALLAGIVYLATRIVPLRANARHALWMTALVAIAVMPITGVAVSLARIHTVPAPTSAPIAHVDFMGTTAQRAHPASGTNSAATSPSNAKIEPAAQSPLNVVALLPHLSHTAAAAFVIIWGFGALIGLGGLLRSLVRVQNLKRRSFPLSVELSDELPWLVEVTRGREMYLRLSDEIETPVAVGFRRPVILIPGELATADGLAAIESLVIHEHAHLARNDDWTNLIQRVIERIFWFNPLVWILGRRIALEREIASDDAVVDRTGEAQAYATSLWRLAREMRMPEHAVVAPGALFTRKQISIRIEQLLAGDRGRLHGSPAAAFTVVAASVIGIVAVATSAPAVELSAPPATPVIAQAPTAPAKPQIHERVILVRKEIATPSHTARVAAAAKAPAGPRAPATPRIVVIETASNAPDTPNTNVALPAHLKLTRDVIANCEGCSLRNADLHGLDLHGLGFHGTDLRGANLQNTNLTDAEFTGAELTNADLRGAIISNTLFQGVQIRGILVDPGAIRSVVMQCMGCDLRGLNLRDADLHGITLHGADFNGADLRGANFSGATLNGINFSHAQLDGVDLSNATLTGCDLRGVSLENVKMNGIRLRGTDLTFR
jgi:uncharacterized protein YjbI with pentapeptide repeats/beta-lactamase regulating signal transducer with metallopeptidase domain